MKKKWKDQNTGKEYDLGHLESFDTTFEVVLKHGSQNEKSSLAAKVVFPGNHCYTKEPENEEKKIERFNDKERIFCPMRWAFSKKLPEIIRNLNYKICLQGNQKSSIYRQEEPSGHNGWYICMKLEYKPDQDPPLELRVKSAHYRTNRPNDVRGAPTRFGILLSKYLESKQQK